MSYIKYPIEFRTGKGWPLNRLYSTWAAMWKRCMPADKDARNYFNRGIKVCAEWKDWPTFAKWALENGYRDDLEIDRRDNYLGYSPDNCRFVDSIEQCRNQRRVRQIIRLEVGDAFDSFYDAARITKIQANNICSAVRGRLKSAGGYTWAYLE